MSDGDLFGQEIILSSGKATDVWVEHVPEAVGADQIVVWAFGRDLLAGPDTFGGLRGLTADLGGLIKAFEGARAVIVERNGS